MPRKLITLLIMGILFSFAYVLCDHENSARAQTTKPALPQMGEEKSDPILAKIESALDKEGPGTVIVADKDGKIIEKKEVQDLLRQGYKSLREFADKKGNSDDCRKISTKCVRCPDGKIYCSNDSKFVSGEKLKM